MIFFAQFFYRSTLPQPEIWNHDMQAGKNRNRCVIRDYLIRLVDCLRQGPSTWGYVNDENISGPKFTSTWIITATWWILIDSSRNFSFIEGNAMSFMTLLSSCYQIHVKISENWGNERNAKWHQQLCISSRHSTLFCAWILILCQQRRGEAARMKQTIDRIRQDQLEWSLTNFKR